MDSAVTLLCQEEPGPAELNLTRIVKFLGGTIQLLKLTPDLALHPERLKEAIPGGSCLITSAQTLAQLGGNQKQGGETRRSLMGLAGNILVYGFEPTQNHSQVLRELTSDVLVGVEPLPSGVRKIHVAREARSVCKQFSGLSFEAVGPERDFAFIQNTTLGAFLPLISIGHNPFFVHSHERQGRMFLLAGRHIANLDAFVPRGTSVLQFFTSLIPVLMFLRYASNHAFWHSDTPAACFIVDDPLLKRRYGFLDFQKLLALMDLKQFCTSIAFIPWNFSRSDRELAKLFAAHPHRYSLCVHGCDHTRGEFGITNHRLLREKAQQALERMNSHRISLGVGFDDVMVFPQGIFSTAAMKTLKSCNYLAAVNSTPYPVDAGGSLVLSDLLQVAVMRFSNFPLFTRRYPQDLAELAFDLFMGKPALVVEHHGFFRDGYGALAETVESLFNLDERLRWGNLAATCSRACLKKVAGNGEIHIQFFTDRFSLRNESAHTRRYVLVQQVSPEDEVRAIVINGRQADLSHEADCVKVQLPLDAGQGAEITVEHSRSESLAVPGGQDRVYKAKVFIRRILSEFRDNHLHTSPFLSRRMRNR